ncbi:MAG: hypothetical protein ABI824_07250 [Acidobacteriota bacterium]
MFGLNSKLPRFASAPLFCAIAVAGLILLVTRPLLPQDRAGSSQAEADSQSAGCVSCHTSTDAASMHASGTVHIGCAFCHGGDASVTKPSTPSSDLAKDPLYLAAKNKAHPQPRLPQLWRSSANPVRPYTDWTKESSEYIRFVNPGDLRIAEKTCGAAACHVSEVRNVQTSMMTHGGMLWGAALYNNGAFPLKNANFGESYAADGTPQRISTYPAPTPEQTRDKGILPFLDPLARWETSQPGNILRVFERGGGPRAEIGNPNTHAEPGHPDDKLSDRGLGTELRTDPVFIGLQKTRLMDPLLSQPGTNDHAGDYRASGCTACHVVYANDRSPVHSGHYAQYGNEGKSAQSDPTIRKDESGHPIRHEFTRSIPTSQCIVCHIHPGTNMVASYLGYIWWDNETDGKKMYPAEQKDPSDNDRFVAWQQNPEGAAVRGLWLDNNFLNKLGTADFNKELEHTQFADFHGHGWVFRAVYKRDRKGNLLDAKNTVVPHEDPKKFDKAVHLMDIHLEKGMHCADCHFEQDSHGNGNLYGETRNAVEIDCIDCHGTINQKANLKTSAAAAPKGGTNMALMRTGTGQRRFYWENDKLYQRSSVEPNKQWEVVQTIDTITPGNEHYNEASRLAKTILKDGTTWGSAPTSDAQLAHSNSKMTCYSCHSSWTTSCFGCHLPMKSNGKAPMLHNEGTETRNYTNYNFEVLRDDIYMLGVDGTVTGNRIAPTRSTCAVVVSSQNANRDWMYYQQQTISTEGFSGFGFSTYVPHTVRASETKTCTSCHVSRDGDNNAWMAQLLMQGTNLVNQIGRFAYVAEGSKGLEAVAVAERDDPPAVFGSDLQQIAYPKNYKEMVEKHHRELDDADHHAGNVLDLQLRGEYLYAALGKDGFRIYDVANIENKNFSERITTAPVSPLGQRFYVKSKYATAVASPSTMAVDPLRNRNPQNEEQSIALMYGFLYVTDAEEGLIVVGDPDLKSKSPGVLTLLDGNPTNNFLKRATTFNPNGVLNGARRITIAGTYAYILTPRGLVVVDISNPVQPALTAQIGAPDLIEPTGVAVQFRYAFVTDKEGLKVLDVTSLAQPKPIRGALAKLEDARNVYVARTYAYVAGGKQGLVIVDVEKPEHPRIDQVFTAQGEIRDTRDVKLGMTNASAFAYIADGDAGLKVVQLFAPTDNPNYLGFSPRPTPKLVAKHKTRGPALAISKGVDRDRAVDESGNQVAVFNRRGSRPFNRTEALRLFQHGNGQVYSVTDTPPSAPVRR